MGRKIGIAVILVVAGLLVAAIALRREPPRMPPDGDHRPALAALATSGPERVCLNCHGPTARRPRGPNHPLADDCGRCHTLGPAEATRTP